MGNIVSSLPPGPPHVAGVPEVVALGIPTSIIDPVVNGMTATGTPPRVVFPVINPVPMDIPSSHFNEVDPVGAT